MALPIAQQIIDRAKSGEKITHKERRHALAYLMVTDVKTNTEIAEIFGVSPRQIRFDIEAIKKEKKEELRVDDLALVVVDLQMNIERQIRDLERSKVKCKEGTDAFMKHCVSIAKIQMDLNKALQDLGWLPKNMGNMSISHFSYEATVGQDGSVVSTRVENLPVQDAEIVVNREVHLLKEPDGSNGPQEDRS